MKNSVKIFLLVAIAAIANVSFAQEVRGLYFQNDSLIKILAKVKSEGKNIFVTGNIIPAEIIQYLRKVGGLVDNQEAEEYYLAHNKKIVSFNSLNWSAIGKFYDSIGVKSPVFKYLVANRTQFYKLFTVDTVDMIIKMVYSSAMNNRSFSNFYDRDTAGYNILRAEFIALKLLSGGTFIHNMDDGLKFSELSSKIQFNERDENWEQYAKTAVPLLDNYYMNMATNISDTLKALMDDMPKFSETAMDEKTRSKALKWIQTVEMLNHVSWTFYEKITDKQMLEKALVWSKKANELDDNNPAIIDTYACLLFKTGQKQKAIKTEEKAIEIINKTPYFLGDRNAYEGKLVEFKK